MHCFKFSALGTAPHLRPPRSDSGFCSMLVSNNSSLALASTETMTDATISSYFSVSILYACNRSLFISSCLIDSRSIVRTRISHVNFKIYLILKNADRLYGLVVRVSGC
jgi:hypothetical protein